MTVIFLLAGLAVLILGAEVVIKPSLRIARYYGISEFIVGLTLLTVGTSIPELFITLVGGYHRLRGLGVSDLIVGDVVGSAVSNIGLIIGVMGLFTTLHLKDKELFKQAFFMVGSAVLLLIVGADGFISRAEGALFLLFYGVYLFIISRQANGQIQEKIKKIKKTKKRGIHLFREISILLTGSLLIMVGANWVVTYGVILAEQLHVSSALIGIFIVGVGTSLPELMVSMTALFNRSKSMSVGNIVGSNIFDILGALGSGTVISGFNLNPQIIKIDIPFLILISVIMVLFFHTRKKLERKEALLLLGLYVGYFGLKMWSSA